jgi:hypothetical protein
MRRTYGVSSVSLVHNMVQVVIEFVLFSLDRLVGR